MGNTVKSYGRNRPPLTEPRTDLTYATLERMHIPEELWRVCLAKVPSSVHGQVRRYLENVDVFVSHGGSLLIGGDHGAGKSSVAALLMRAARRWGYTGLFTSVFELREILRMKKPWDTDIDYLDRCYSANVLTLDDLSRGIANDLGSELLAGVIKHRRAKKLATFITTVLNPQDLVKLPVVHEAMDFMAELEVTGPNLREAKRDKLEAVLDGAEAF